MRKQKGNVTIISCCTLVCITLAPVPAGRAADWTTAGNDAQRSLWVRTDPKISPARMEKPGFQLLWKLQLNNQPQQMNALMPAVLLDFYIGHRGFRALAFVGGSSDNVFTIDTDLGRIEWQRHFSSMAPPQTSSWNCPGGMTTSLTRPTAVAFPVAVAGRGAGGPGTPARSAVGEPGKGAVTLAAAASSNPPIRRPPAVPANPRIPHTELPNPYRRGPTLVYALSGDGLLHSMYVSNGVEPAPPSPFLPPLSNAQGLIVVGDVAYAATAGGCGGAPNGLWALDLASKQVSSWHSKGGISGSSGVAFGPDGTIYAATEDGELFSLEPKTLHIKNSYNAGRQGFTSSPVVFEHNGRALVAAAAKDGRLHLLDAATLSALYKTPARSSAVDSLPAALTTWQDIGGTRWLLEPVAGPVSSDGKSTPTNDATHSAIVAWKVLDEDGAPALQPGWVSRDLVSPLSAVVVNGVVFVVSSGEFHSNATGLTAEQRASRSTHAVFYALDGKTGKELWNSGDTIGSFVHGGGLSSGGSQVYLGTHDGMLYAFGFPIEH